MTEPCADCGSPNITETIVTEQLPYHGGIIIEVENIPVIHCNSCNFTYTDYRAEELRDTAVKQYQISKGIIRG